MSEHVLVVGGTLTDVKGKPLRGLAPGTSNPGRIQFSRGGTARNVAENLGRLGAEVVLISAIGADLIGESMIRRTADTGVDTSHVIVVPDATTGTYIALLDDDGSLAVALDDVTVMDQITPEYLQEREALFAEAKIILVDGSLNDSTLEAAFQLATEHRKPICADPSSARMAHRLRSYLSRLHLVVPNELEAAMLCDKDYEEYDPEASQEMALQLNRQGANIAVVTLRNFGLMYATDGEYGFIPPRFSEMVDSTGTGDALTAAILFGLVNEFKVTECMRLGAAAAGLTLQSEETVVPDLSLDLLYDHLVG
jgi:pseudouridine kinase